MSIVPYFPHKNKPNSTIPRVATINVIVFQNIHQKRGQRRKKSERYEGGIIYLNSFSVGISVGVCVCRLKTNKEEIHAFSKNIT